MAEFDLIPSDYRRRLAALAIIRSYAIAAALLVACSVAAYAGLSYARQQFQARIDVLQQKNAITNSQQADLEQLGAEQSKLSERIHLLEGLSGGITAQRMLLALDRALSGDDVWFTRLGFARDGQLLDKQAEPVATGYFLIVPSGPGQTESKTLRIDSQMTVHGQARDHAALSAFIGRLIAQPEVATTHLLNATAHDSAGVSTVEFELLVGINMTAGR